MYPCQFILFISLEEEFILENAKKSVKIGVMPLRYGLKKVTMFDDRWAIFKISVSMFQ